MNTVTVGVGMIGCGGMGISVARHLLAQAPDVELRGMFDPLEDAINSAKKQLNVDPKVYNDYHELLASDDIQWVLIASWNCHHYQQVLDAFDAGKHVFCQKPLGITPEECVAMYRRWKKTNLMFSIGFTLRYSPHYRKINSLIREGAIGDIISFEFNETLDFNHGGYIMGDWRRLREYAGTHLLEKCCHDLDLANWMVDSKAKRVASFGGLNFFKPENAHHIERLGKNKDGVDAYRTWQHKSNKFGPSMNPFTSDKDIIDNQVAIIEYENGVRATFHTNCNTGLPERRMYVCGTEGTIRSDVRNGQLQVCRIGFDTEVEDVQAIKGEGHGGGDSVLAKELADSMLKGAAPAAGIEDGLFSSFTAFAIDEAMDNGTIIDLEKYYAMLK